MITHVSFLLLGLWQQIRFPPSLRCVPSVFDVRVDVLCDGWLVKNGLLKLIICERGRKVMSFKEERETGTTHRSIPSVQRCGTFRFVNSKDDWAQHSFRQEREKPPTIRYSDRRT